MSDTASTPAKRGRRAAANSEKPAEKGEAKKRDHKKVESTENGDDEGVVTAKRGRGRPKGTTKKRAAKPKAKSTGGRRGRPKKAEVDEKEKSSNEEEEGEEEEEEEEDEDD